MEMPLPSYLFTYISFEQLFFFFVILCPFSKKRKNYHLPIFFFQEVDQQNNYMVTGVVPLDSGGEITGRGSGAAGRRWKRIVGNFSGWRQVKKRIKLESAWNSLVAKYKLFPEPKLTPRYDWAVRGPIRLLIILPSTWRKSSSRLPTPPCPTMCP